VLSNLKWFVMAGLDPATQRSHVRARERLDGIGNVPRRGRSHSAAPTLGHRVAGAGPARTAWGLRAVLAASAVALLAATAHAVPFDVYRAACLDTGVDLAKVRAQAAAQKWAALTDAEREKLSPGNPAAVEGWAIVDGGARHLVSISGATVEGGMTGDRSGSNVVSCGTLSPKSDEKLAAKAYSAFLKRQPSEDRADGFVTYTWSVQDASNVNYHYLVAGANMPGLSLSVSSIRK